MNTDRKNELLAAARGDEPGDLLIENVKPVSLTSGEVMDGDCLIRNGRIAGVGDYTDARETYDAGGDYLIPRFIDAHMHLESTMLSAAEFCRATVPRGTGAVVIDPHEYANVWGTDGLEFVLEETGDLPVDFFVMASSCVPASPFETSGAVLSAEDLKPFLSHPRVPGLAEMMNYPGAINGDPDVLEKIHDTGDRPIDGHAPGVMGKDLNAYLACGPRSDHESTTTEEAKEKLRKGMHLYLRHGSSEHNLPELIPAVNEYTEPFCHVATDDRHPGDLKEEGHIDAVLREAFRHGLDVFRGLRMASYHTANHYGLDKRGAIVPGYHADLCLVSELDELDVRTVFHRGDLVYEQDRGLQFSTPTPPAHPETPMEVDPVDPNRFTVPADGTDVRVIRIVPGQILTEHDTVEMEPDGGALQADPERDLAKMVVIDRYSGEESMGVGFVNGFGLDEGALGSTIAHDSHNIICAGVSDRAMAACVNRLINDGGGIAAADDDGEVRSALPLPVAGLTTREPLEDVVERHRAAKQAADALGCDMDTPYMTLSFLALTPVPELKLTDQGLFDALNYEPVDLFV